MATQCGLSAPELAAKRSRLTAKECIGQIFGEDGLLATTSAMLSSAEGSQSSPCLQHPLFFVQIGASVGDSPHDPIFKLVAKNKWPGLLIEPLTHAFEALKVNYSKAGCGPNQLSFEQCAISDSPGRRLLHYVDEGEEGFQKLTPQMQEAARGTASFDKQHPQRVVKAQGGTVKTIAEVCMLHRTLVFDRPSMHHVAIF
eukprot:SAG31_NODE_18151_length_645_cov_1.076923_1_plen_199_part_00